MAYASIYKEVMRYYDRLGDKARAVQSERMYELYERSPRLRELDDILAQTGARVARAVLEGGGRELACEIKNTALALNAEKREIIKTLGYPPDYLTDIYSCPKCKDTGTDDSGGRCICFKQQLINKLYDQSGLANILGEENFDTFDFRYYSDAIDPRAGISPVANIRAIYSVCESFIEGFESRYTNLLFYGDTGLGKTFLCNCIAKALMDAGKSVLYATAPRFFKRLEDQRFNRIESHDTDERFDMSFNADLLIIDDLGTEFSSIVTNSELFNIINTRILEKRSIIISTNLSINEFQSTYSDRIASRFFGNFKMLKFFGDDIRVKKKLYFKQEPVYGVSENSLAHKL